MPSCCHPSCKMNDLINKRENLRLKFYRFPTNHERKLLWLTRIGCEQEKFKIGWKLCSRHFHENNFDPCTRRLLKTSIPDSNTGSKLIFCKSMPGMQ